MEREKTVVLGIDPGSGFVGWSLGANRRIKDYGQDSPDDFLMRLQLDTPPQRAAIERFDIRQFTVDSQLTVELIGAIKWICKIRMIPYGFVNASSKGKFLSQVPIEIRGHARDAEAVRLYDLYYGSW